LLSVPDTKYVSLYEFIYRVLQQCDVNVKHSQWVQQSYAYGVLEFMFCIVMLLVVD